MTAPAVVVAVWLLVACSLLCCALAVVCIVRGRTQADRVVALDILVAAAVVLSVAAALQTGRTVFLDVAIGLSLVGFVGTIGWARLIDRSVTAPQPQPPTKSSPAGGPVDPPGRRRGGRR